MMRSFRRALALTAASLLAVVTHGHALGAQAVPQVVPSAAVNIPDMLHVQGRDADIALITAGDGDEIWEMFGHAAIWIHDNRTARDTVFNWGVFDMRAPFFILHFLQGLNVYRMGGDPLSYVMLYYRHFNRTLTAQHLDLTDAQKDSIISIIRTNALPENVNYRYDYFVDNCSTRPRDILDQVLGGQLRVGSDSLPGTTYRYHALRLMQSNGPLVAGVDIGLGEPSDRPITKWQEMFLPEKLHDWVATRQIRDSSGATRPLVKAEQVLYLEHGRPAEPLVPPRLGLWLTLIGVVLGVIFLVVGVRGRGMAGPVLFSIWSIVAGLLGIALTLLWTVTDHRFAHYNENLLIFNPLWLILAVMLPRYLRSGKAPNATRKLTLTLTGLTVLALLAHLVFLSRQSNLAVIG
ncbi:MAG TPA: DUF4105 domain-containing protein, partial [Gemmatimonadaceae bacterium]